MKTGTYYTLLIIGFFRITHHYILYAKRYPYIPRYEILDTRYEFSFYLKIINIFSFLSRKKIIGVVLLY